MMKLYIIFPSTFCNGSVAASFFHGKANQFVTGRRTIFLNLKDTFLRNTSAVIWVHCASLEIRARKTLDGVAEKNISRQQNTPLPSSPLPAMKLGKNYQEPISSSICPGTPHPTPGDSLNHKTGPRDLYQI